MSLLPPDVQPALSQLLGALSSPDNRLRTQAEEQLNNDWIQNRPDVLLMGLTEQVQGAGDAVVSRPGCLRMNRRYLHTGFQSSTRINYYRRNFDLVPCSLF